MKEIKGKEYQFIGILDQYKVEGEIEGVPILEWNQVNEEDVDMLRISNMKRIEMCVGSINEKSILGLVIADIFNNPFALYHTQGKVVFKEAAIWSQSFVAPLVWFYLVALIQEVITNNVYEGVLFSDMNSQGTVQYMLDFLSIINNATSVGSTEIIEEA